jgi:hypothetical protein
MTRILWFVLGAVVGGALALALFAKPLCQRSVSSVGRDWLSNTFGSSAGGVLGDLFDNLVAKV